MGDHLNSREYCEQGTGNITLMEKSANKLLKQGILPCCTIIAHFCKITVVILVNIYKNCYKEGLKGASEFPLILEGFTKEFHQRLTN